MILLECMLSCVRCRRSVDSQESLYAQAVDDTDYEVCTNVILNKYSYPFITKETLEN